MFETKINQDIDTAKMLLLQDEVVAIPTETVYGLAGNALSSDAILKIFEVKNRPFFDPLIIHVHNIAAVEKWVTHLPEKAKLLFEQFSPGPITILLPKKDNISDLVTSGLPQVAIRIPNHPLTLALLEGLDLPLAAPSANPFGYISPTTAQHVFDQLQGKIHTILDGGDCPVGVESTIVGFEDDQVIVYRLGGLEIEAIESIVGAVKVMQHSSSNPKAPGMLKSHYAPRKPFFLRKKSDIRLEKGKKIGILSFTDAYPEATSNEVLSSSGNLAEAAKKLFASMRNLDNQDIDYIIAEELPDISLGRAINDRLRRAAAEE